MLLWMSFTAAAFQPPTGDGWPPESLPLQIEVPTSTCSLGTACFEAAQDAAEHWSAVPCLGLSAEVVSTDEPGKVGDGVNQLNFADPERYVADFNFSNPTIPELLFVVDGGDEVDFHTLDGLPFATHDDVLAGECYEQIDLLAFSTVAIGRMLRLAPTTYNGTPRVFDFWSLRACDPDRAVIDGIAGRVFEFSPGIELDCEPFGLTEGFAIERVPVDLSCEVVPAVGQDSLFMPYEDLEWDWGDGTITRGLSGQHTYTEGGVHQIVVTGFLDGDRCDLLRGSATAALTLCPLVEADLTFDEPRGRTIHVRNLAETGPPGCDVDAAWEIYEGSSADGPVIYETNAWSPFLTLPAPGMYTAQVTLTALDGVTLVEEITFEVGSDCGCATSTSATWWLGLLPLALLRRRR